MDQLPSLRRPAEEVRRLLAGRIEAGQELLDRVHAVEGAPSRSTHEELSEAFHSWDRYNDALLRKVFEGPEIAERYRQSKPVMMVRSLTDEFNALNRRLRGALAEMRATGNLLELLDEEPDTAARSSSDEERDAYFQLLYERTGGRTDQTVASKDIGAALGLTDEVRSDVEDFLRAEGLIEFVAFGPQVELTHAGRRRAEQGQRVGAPASANAATVIVMGDMTGGTIQQAGPQSKQKVEVSSVTVIEAARQWLDEVTARISDQTLVFPGDLHDEATDHIEALQAELQKLEPERKRIKASLRTLRRLLEQAGGQVIAQGLLTSLPHIINAL